MKILGYSERGIINSLIKEAYYIRIILTRQVDFAKFKSKSDFDMDYLL